MATILKENIPQKQKISVEADRNFSFLFLIAQIEGRKRKTSKIDQEWQGLNPYIHPALQFVEASK